MLWSGGKLIRQWFHWVMDDQELKETLAQLKEQQTYILEQLKSYATAHDAHVDDRNVTLADERGDAQATVTARRLSGISLRRYAHLRKTLGFPWFSVSRLNARRAIGAEAVDERDAQSASGSGAPVRKDVWDKIQCIAPIVSGLLIGGFAGFVGYSYNQQQIKLQEAETIERFIPHLAGNEKTKKAAILAMSSLTNASLAAKMAALFASEGTVSALQSIAQTGSTKDRSVATEAMATAFGAMAQRSVDDNNLGQAEDYLRKAISIKEKMDGAESPDLCSSLDRLSELYVVQGKPAAAEPLLRRSLALKEKNQGTDSADTKQSMRRLAEVLALRGNTAEADQLRKKARTADNASPAGEATASPSGGYDSAKSEDSANSKQLDDPSRDSESSTASGSPDTTTGPVTEPEPAYARNESGRERHSMVPAQIAPVQQKESSVH